jgi:hypothetical protein
MRRLLIYSALVFAGCETSSPSTSSGQVDPDRAVRWDEAHGWGNHGEAGYLKSESDPVFKASAAAWISSTTMEQWNQAHAWGNHSSAGYLKAEMDPKIGNLVMDTVPRWNGTALVSSAIRTDEAGNINIGQGGPVIVQVGAGGLGEPPSHADFGQSFQAPMSGSFDRFGLYIDQCISGTLTVYSGDGVSGAVLHQQPVTVNGCSQWEDSVQFQTAVPVTAGTKYTVRIQATSPATINSRWDTSIYPDGAMYTNGTATPGDMMFKVWIIGDTSPLSVSSSGKVTLRDVIRLEPRDEAPILAEEGDIYYDRGLRKIRFFDGVAWNTL